LDRDELFQRGDGQGAAEATEKTNEERVVRGDRMERRELLTGERGRDRAAPDAVLHVEENSRLGCRRAHAGSE
jgi:hypothetical protein